MVAADRDITEWKLNDLPNKGSSTEMWTCIAVVITSTSDNMYALADCFAAVGIVKRAIIRYSHNKWEKWMVPVCSRCAGTIILPVAGSSYFNH